MSEKKEARLADNSSVNSTRSVEPHLVNTYPNNAPLRPLLSTSQPGAEPMFPGGDKCPETTNNKLAQLTEFHSNPEGKALRTNQGVRISDNQNSLKAGYRGSTLLEDFILREKITHFDHERIPERVVHARGAGAHGYFQAYKPLTDVTSAGFLQDPNSRKIM